MKRLTFGAHVVDWVAKRTNEYGNFGAAQGIGLQEMRPQEHFPDHWVTIAGVAYAEWNGVNVVCHIAAERGCRWLTREYLWTILDYPFNQLGVRRITVCVGQGNKASRGFVEHLGFSQEAALSEAHPTGDLIIYKLFAEDCKYIQVKSREKKAA